MLWRTFQDLRDLRDENGHYMVSLAFKENQPLLGTLKTTAEQWFQALQMKIQWNVNDFMN